MDLKLKDRVAFVGGSSRGIGKAVAAAFMAEGCRTVITGRGAEALRQAQAELEAQFGADRVLAIEGDLTQVDVLRAAVDRVTGRWGEIDCAVANVGTGRGKPGWDVGEEDWATLFDMNLWSATRLVTQVLPAMTRRRAGSIVLMSSIVGVEATPAPIPYSAAKGALLNYAKNVARQVGPTNVRVNCVAPGNIFFPGGSWERHLSARHDEVMNHIRTEVPLQRFGTPQEIADLVVFLSSDRAAFVTGACVVADGGQTRGV